MTIRASTRCFSSYQFHGPGRWRSTSVACIVIMTESERVIVYGYVDRVVPVLARMAAKREKGYKALGYVPSLPPSNQ